MVAVIRIKKSSPKHFNAVTDILSGMGNNEVKGRKSSIKTVKLTSEQCTALIRNCKIKLINNNVKSSILRQTCKMFENCSVLVSYWNHLGKLLFCF